MRLLASLLFTIAASSTAGAQPKGTLLTDRFIRGKSGLPATINVTYIPNDSSNTARTTIYVASSGDVVAEPSRLDLQPNTPTPVRLQLLTFDFAEESVTVQSACCPIVKVVIEPGANHQLTIAPNSEVSDREIFAITLSAVDADGKTPLKCRESLVAYLAPVGGQIRRDETEPWAQSAISAVGPGNDLGTGFQILPTAALLGGSIDLKAQLRTPEGVVLLSRNTNIPIAASPIVNFIATVVGALVWTLIRILKTKPERGTKRFSGRMPDLLIAILSGIVAFFFALGLKKYAPAVAIDWTRPAGFVVLGLLVSFGGVESLLRLLVKEEGRRKKDATPVATNDEVVTAISDLRRTFDKIFLGKGVDDEKSLYSYVERHVNPLYAGSQREEESVVMTCKRVEGEAQFDLLLTTTRNPPAIAASSVEPIKVDYQEPLLSGLTDETLARKRQLIELTFELAGWRYASNVDHTELVLNTGQPKVPEDFPPSIPIVVRITSKSIIFGYEIELPPSLRKGRFSYKSKTVWRRPTDPDFFIWTVSHPTRVFNFDCHFPDDVLVQADSFSLTSSASSSETLFPEPAYGNAHLSVGDWLLPGHGVVVMWSSLAGGLKSTP